MRNSQPRPGRYRPARPPPSPPLPGACPPLSGSGNPGLDQVQGTLEFMWSFWVHHGARTVHDHRKRTSSVAIGSLAGGRSRCCRWPPRDAQAGIDGGQDISLVTTSSRRKRNLPGETPHARWLAGGDGSDHIDRADVPLGTPRIPPGMREECRSGARRRRLRPGREVDQAGDRGTCGEDPPTTGPCEPRPAGRREHHGLHRADQVVPYFRWRYDLIRAATEPSGDPVDGITGPVHPHPMDSCDGTQGLPGRGLCGCTGGPAQQDPTAW